jgi:two-component system sensor histidine kinase YesM
MERGMYVEDKNRNFRDKIKYLFLKYALIPILILYILFFIFIIFTTRIRAVNNANKAGDLVGDTISQVYNNYYDEIERMSKSNIVVNFVYTHLSSNLVYEEFYKFNNLQKVKSAFHIVDKNGVFLAYTTPSNPYIDEAILKTIIPRIEKNPREVLVEANKMEFSHGRYTVYTFGKAIYKDSEIIGYIIYQLYEEDIQKLIFVQNAEVVVVTDQYDRIIASTSNIVKGLMNKFIPEYTDSMRYVKIKDGKYHMIKKSLPKIPINIYTLNSIEFNNAIFIFYGIFTMIVSLLIYLLINYFADKISSENTKSIDKLLEAVYDLQYGNMNSYVYLNTGDEFEILANQYNIMLDRLNKLIMRNEELSNIRRINEIKQLEAQFNPHFLFNVLETLRYTIVMDQEQAQDIIMTLSRLLRYSIKNREQSVLFKEDLAYIEDYLKLHKIRFKDRLNYYIDVSQEIINAFVPKLLLQAVIENSIKYGYKEKDYLTITITGRILNEDLVFEVKDNGSGMTTEELAAVRKILREPENMTKHIGLYNVHRRLVLLYGERYGLEINSIYGEGTFVKITIPYGKEDNNV